MRIPSPCIALLLAAVLAGCAATPPADVVHATGTTTYPPTQYVDVLERAPAKPYVEVGTIDVPGEPGTLRPQVIAQILSRAQQLGANAVILTDLSRPAPAAQRLNPTTGTYENVGGQMIYAFKGVAIRYR